MTVSIRPASESRGGATGSNAKKAKPIRPEMIIASRSSRYFSRRCTYSTVALTTITGQCP